MENFNDVEMTRRQVTNQSMVDLIIRHMSYFSMVHYVKTDILGVRFFCENMSLSNSGLQDVMRDLPLCSVRIEDGLLTFDLDAYGGTRVI